MKIHEIREMKDDELIKQIDLQKKELVDLRFAHQLKQLTNTSKLRLVKKDLAKLKTILRDRELANIAATKKENQEGVKA
ncbi:MAG TPA: 50S ribosomal protein L29 [Ignavibacteriaceae bacterium]|nr:50S ribosomal protein L29 [Ignavibacteriaceae bacterium]